MGAILVNSTAISSAAYDPDEQVFEVQYAGGKGWVYRYRGVPAELFDEFTDAWVLGEFVNRRIKPHYPFERLSPEQAAGRPLKNARTWPVPLEGGFTKARKRLQRWPRRGPVSRSSRRRKKSF